MVTCTSAFPNRPFNARLEAWFNWQSGSRVSVHVEFWIDKTAYSPTYSNAGKSSWDIGDYYGTPFARSGQNFDFRNGNNFLIFSADYESSVNNAGQFGLALHANYDILGYASCGLTIQGTPLNPPPAPTSVRVDNATTTSLRYIFSGNGDGGSPITAWQWQRALDAGFTQGATAILNGSGTENDTGLNPGTTYYYRSRGCNAIGCGAWSNVISGTTLPAVPPGLTVTPSPSGLSATATLTPPGGLSGVTSYLVERRLKGSSTATQYTTSTPSLTVTSLTPGSVYQWRASAFFGSYQSPWSTWQDVQQPNPSTSPGDYFDGSTAATTDQSFAWTGTANLSTSQAIGHAPTGWSTFAAGNATSGGTGVVARVSDPQFGAFGARVTFFTDTTAAGFRAGTAAVDPGRADITAGGEYSGSIFVKPSRAQSMAAEITWLDVAGALVSRSVGTAQLVPSGTWTRLSVTATAPALAEWAAIRVIDVAGTGWALWKAGETLVMDAAMISLGAVPLDYFDGSFPATSTYTFSWTGTANASTSLRENVISNTADALIDPDCEPIPAPPRPPAVPDPCIEDLGTWRRYAGMLSSVYVSDWLDVLPTFTITTFGLAERQLRIRIYPNPFNFPISQVNTSDWCAEQIISYIPANTVMTLDGEIQRVFASVAGGPTQAADHLLYGTGGSPATWPVLTCGMSYLVTIDTPVSGTAPPPGNVKWDVVLTRRTY